MENKKSRKSALSILFYLLAVIFLCIAAFAIWNSYSQVEAYKTQYALKLTEVLNVYFTGCAQFFGFSFLFYGIGKCISKVHDIHQQIVPVKVKPKKVSKDPSEIIDPIKEETKTAETPKE